MDILERMPFARQRTKYLYNSINVHRCIASLLAKAGLGHLEAQPMYLVTSYYLDDLL